LIGLIEPIKGKDVFLSVGHINQIVW